MVVLVIHSLFRWLVLVGLVLRPVLAIADRTAARPYDSRARRFTGIMVGLLDLQVVIGLVLMGVSPLMANAMRNMAASMADDNLRFFLVEHPTIMVIAAIVAHIASFVARRQSDPRRSHLIIIVGFSIATLLVLGGIPWDRVF